MQKNCRPTELAELVDGDLRGSCGDTPCAAPPFPFHSSLEKPEDHFATHGRVGDAGGLASRAISSKKSRRGVVSSGYILSRLAPASRVELDAKLVGSGLDLADHQPRRLSLYDTEV